MESAFGSFAALAQPYLFGRQHFTADGLEAHAATNKSPDHAIRTFRPHLIGRVYLLTGWAQSVSLPSQEAEVKEWLRGAAKLGLRDPCLTGGVVVDVVSCAKCGVLESGFSLQCDLVSEAGLDCLLCGEQRFCHQRSITENVEETFECSTHMWITQETISEALAVHGGKPSRTWDASRGKGAVDLHQAPPGSRGTQFRAVSSAYPFDLFPASLSHVCEILLGEVPGHAGRLSSFVPLEAAERLGQCWDRYLEAVQLEFSLQLRLNLLRSRSWTPQSLADLLSSQARNKHDILSEVQKDNSNQEREAEEVEAVACRFGDLTWKQQGVPPPDFSVINDDAGPAVRAELSLFTRHEPEGVHESRVRGPRRKTVPEARKDGSQLLRVAFATNGSRADIKSKIAELEVTQWSAADLLGEDVDEGAERRLPEFTTATQAEKFKEQEKSVSSLREWIYAKKEEQLENFQPSGPSWSLAGQAMAVPRLPGVWYVHERQQEGGRPLPIVGSSWYSAQSDLRADHNADQRALPTSCHSAAIIPLLCYFSWPPAVLTMCSAKEGGRKDDLAVALVDLPRTAQALKQPVPFIDKPASLFAPGQQGFSSSAFFTALLVLVNLWKQVFALLLVRSPHVRPIQPLHKVMVDGLRSSSVASEFCAKRFHSQILPRLSCRSDPLEDHESGSEPGKCELVAIVQDFALLESTARYSGCGLAVALLMGRRLVVGTLGDCRVFLCTRGSPAKGSTAKRPAGWEARQLANGEDACAASAKRLSDAYSRLEPGPLRASSASPELLASQPNDVERALLRIDAAAHPFAALGLSVAACQGGISSLRQAVADCEAVLTPALSADGQQDRARRALSRVQEAAAEVESFMGMDVYVTQILAELYYLIDEEGGIPSPKRAAALLGVEPGCGEAAAQAGIDRRYRALLAQLAAVSPGHSQRAFRVLAELADAAARPSTPPLWIPSGDRSVRVTRSLGFRDLKRPRPLVGLELSSEVVRLDDGPQLLALLSDGARGLSEQRLAEVAAVHHSRPKAASMRIAADAASSAQPGEAVGVIAAALQVGTETESNPAADAKGPEAKKRKVEHVTPGGKRKVRVASLLLKYAGVSEADSYARRKAPANRSQVDAEKQLLQVLEALSQDAKTGEAKDLGLRFAAKCEALSDCKSATNKPHADLGWVLEGQFGKDFDAVAFDLDEYDGFLAFAYTKRAQVLLCEHWATEFPEVKAVSCHPGWVEDRLSHDMYGESAVLLEPMRDAWAGAFYLDKEPQSKHLAGPFFSEGTATHNSSALTSLGLTTAEQMSAQSPTEDFPVFDHYGRRRPAKSGFPPLQDAAVTVVLAWKKLHRATFVMLPFTLGPIAEASSIRGALLPGAQEFLQRLGECVVFQTLAMSGSDNAKVRTDAYVRTVGITQYCGTDEESYTGQADARELLVLGALGCNVLRSYGCPTACTWAWAQVLRNVEGLGFAPPHNAVASGWCGDVEFHAEKEASALHEGS
ncbi:unnamed protein product [Symbiodinium sp. KB8]|nr:unnamed protein product [Symbiodinium sp. KB8]